jgi:N-acetylglucosaminyl-diphospho-decaprenol L-rhamnosyltransferase
MTLALARAVRPVTAVVVTYQSAGTIGAALEAMRRCHDAGIADCVVVDNGSSDATAELLERERAWATVILTGRNNGFGRGCNIGFEHVESPYTLLLNPDAVIEPEAVRTMVAFLDEHPRVGIVGPAIVEGSGAEPGELQRTGARLDPVAQVLRAIPLLRAGTFSRPIQPGSEPFRTGWVCGAMLMIRTSLMRRLGGFDPRFFLYWEEIDLCKRAEDAGAETWVVATALGRHVGGASSAPDDTRFEGCVARHYFQSRYYYMRKHHGWVAATAAELVEFGMLLLRSAADVLRGRGAARLRPRLQAPLFSQPDRPER